MRHIFYHEIKYYFKNHQELFYIYNFFVLLILTIPLGLGKELHALHELAPAVLWVAILTSVSLGGANLFQRDAESGVLEVYPQLSTSLYHVVLIKWLAFYLAMLLPLLAALPVFLILVGIGQDDVWRYGIAMVSGGSAISIISALTSILTVGMERARAVTMLITMPLAAPILIFGSDYLHQTDSLWQPTLMFMVAFSIFLLPLLCLAGASCIRNHN